MSKAFIDQKMPTLTDFFRAIVRGDAAFLREHGRTARGHARATLARTTLRCGTRVSHYLAEPWMSPVHLAAALAAADPARMDVLDALLEVGAHVDYKVGLACDERLARALSGAHTGEVLAQLRRVRPTLPEAIPPPNLALQLYTMSPRALAAYAPSVTDRALRLRMLERAHGADLATARALADGLPWDDVVKSVRYLNLDDGSCMMEALLPPTLTPAQARALVQRHNYSLSRATLVRLAPFFDTDAMRLQALVRFHDRPAAEAMAIAGTPLFAATHASHMHVEGGRRLLDVMLEAHGVASAGEARAIATAAMYSLEPASHARLAPFVDDATRERMLYLSHRDRAAMLAIAATLPVRRAATQLMM